MLLGITKASLKSRQLLSAASFQDTTTHRHPGETAARVPRLTICAASRKNVIMGHIIPAGTGFRAIIARRKSARWWTIPDETGKLRKQPNTRKKKTRCSI